MIQIEISKSYGRTEWVEDLKKIFVKAGAEGGDGRPTVFLFDDTQIVYESFLEDVNLVLNTGEVPNLFVQEDLAAINDQIGKNANAAGVNTGVMAEMYKYFISRCRANLHVVLTMSPIGDAFRRRLRMFPALVNCCTIDWFTAWPEEALRSVAEFFLGSEKMDDEVRAGVVNICVDMQERVSTMSSKFLQEMGRHYYVTPTSYLELINTFKKLLEVQREDVMERKVRYDNGLEKILSTEAQVDGMQRDLVALQPKLKQATIDTDALLEKIAVDTKEANKVEAVVSTERKLCNDQAAEAAGIAESCQADLDKAMPALEGAIAALKSLSKGDIVEIKAMKKPPDAVKLVMEAVCLMMAVKPDKIKDPNGGNKKIDDYWGPAQKNLLGDPRFLQHLMEYDRDNMAPAMVEKVITYTTKEQFQVDVVKKASIAAAGLCRWVSAMMIYDKVAKDVGPKKKALKEAEQSLKSAKEALEEKEATLAEVQKKLQTLQDQLDAANKKKGDLQTQVTDCATKLERAEQLIKGLGGEKVRWNELSEELAGKYENVTGDILLSSGVIAYLGAFVVQYRDDALSQWKLLLDKFKIPFTDGFTLRSTLGDEVAIRSWVINKLPNDEFSIENAIMLERSNRWPLMIDPQGQANKWVKKTYAENLKVVKLNQATFARTIENAIPFGNPIIKQGGVNSLRFGDSTIEYDERFRMFITTKMRNPHYPPELCVKVNLLNFMATTEGLEDQMLGLAVACEEAELEAQREQLVMEDAENKRQLKEIEDKILYLLKTAEGNILDDENLIDTLKESKIKSKKIEEKLFFCIADLSIIDPMYQYSMEWYQALFRDAMGKAAFSTDLEERLASLKDTFTYILYQNVCRSLFEKDKLLFSFLLTVKIMSGQSKLDPTHLRFFLAGNTSMERERSIPETDWLADKSWGDVLAIGKLEGFEGFVDKFVDNLDMWKTVYESKQPMEDLVQSFVREEMGARFIEVPQFDLNGCFADSRCNTPLLFVLTPGADPMSALARATSRTRPSREAQDKGTWVCLQNCHLCISWMPTLERLCEELSPDRINDQFRLWLTSEPSTAFPAYILQNGIKMTIEPPKGMRANLIGSYTTLITTDFVEGVKRSAEFKKLLFGLCFFHAVVRERRKFGPLGWNIQYVFSGSDLKISMDQLRIFLDNVESDEEVPYAALRYLTGECNYGGRVTDDKDRRCLANMLTDFYSEDIQNPSYTFSPSGRYYAPPDGDLASYTEYIKGLPYTEGPELFGLHDNANITCALGETNLLLSTVLSLQPRSSGGAGKSWDDELAEVSSDIEARLPKLYDIERALIDFPVLYEESMNTVLTQEPLRFNKLSDLIKRLLKEVQRAIKGLVVMSGELESMGNAMVNGKFLQDWVDARAAPNTFWISGFFFTQAFITGTLQNYARKYQLPIDTVAFDFAILTPEKEVEAKATKAPDGSICHGLFLEGARWDVNGHVIAESRPRELYTVVPMFHMMPRVKGDIPPIKGRPELYTGSIGGEAHMYQCPIYKRVPSVFGCFQHWQVQWSRELFVMIGEARGAVDLDAQRRLVRAMQRAKDVRLSPRTTEPQKKEVKFDGEAEFTFYDSSKKANTEIKSRCGRIGGGDFSAYAVGSEFRVTAKTESDESCTWKITERSNLRRFHPLLVDLWGIHKNMQGNTTYANSDSCTVNFDFVFDVAKTQQARCALSGIPLKAESLPPLDSSTQTYPRKVSPERPDDNDRGYHEHNFYLVLACFNAHLVFGWGKWTKFMIDVLWFEYGVPPPVELHSNSIPFAATKADIVAPHKNFVEMHAKGTGVFGPKGVFTLRAAAADAARAADAAHAAAAARAAAASGADAAYAATDTDMPDAPAGLANIVDVSAPAPAAASAATMPAPAPAAASAAATTTAASQRDGDIRDFFFKSKPKKSSRREPSSPSKRPAQRPRSESTETAGAVAARRVGGAARERRGGRGRYGRGRGRRRRPPAAHRSSPPGTRRGAEDAQIQARIRGEPRLKPPMQA
ncbi:1-aminocyclopropane-1-carboxylate synthase [Aureococcus anophagefferens]|nr:1-aminocyclopropane-1-carboxylate synthase [Aureococcus anophagefferens]